MSTNDWTTAELQQLMDRLLDQTISVDEHQRLQGILKSDETARQEYLRYIDLHFALIRLHAPVGDLPQVSRAALDAILEETQTLLTEDLTTARLPDQSDNCYPSLNRVDSAWMYRATVAVSLAMSAVALISLSWFLWQRPQWSVTAVETKQPQVPTLVLKEPGTGVASNACDVRLLESASAKFFMERMPGRGECMIFDHEYALSEGSIKMAFPSGATTVINAPAVFQILGNEHLLLSTGVCSVHAPEGAAGFLLDTPVGRVIDLGTRFVVDVELSGEAEVQVIEGAASVIPAKPLLAEAPAAISPSSERSPTVAQGQRDILLKQGQARRLMAKDPVSIQSIPFSAEMYHGELPDRVISFLASEDPSGAVDMLHAVTLQRAGNEITYQASDLIGIDVMHATFSNTAIMVTPEAISDPSKPDPANLPRTQYLDRDHSLCSGLINPGGQTEPLTNDPILQHADDSSDQGDSWSRHSISSAVTNSAGQDIVMFELQTIVNSEQGDAFHVSPLQIS